MNTRGLICSSLLLSLLLSTSAEADDSERAARRAARRARQALVEVPVQVAPEPVPTASAPRKVRLSLGELATTPDALRLSTRATESFAFTARADQVLTAAELELTMQRPEQIPDLTALEVLLNGEPIKSFSAQELAGGGTRRVPLDPSLLASTNLLSLRLRTAHDAEACGVVPAGTWSALRKGALHLSSADLPLPNDLAVLPLPFFDANFDRDQVLHFVLATKPTPAQLTAANLVAGWFALQGKGRLSFEAHAGALPRESAVVFVSDRATAESLQLAVPEDQSIAWSGLELRAHPSEPAAKLLVVWGLGSTGLLPASRLLVRDGIKLSGTALAAAIDLTLPELPPRTVPRVLAPGDVVLGNLPEKPALRVAGGHSETIRIPFRLSPDLFLWPKDHVELDLGYAQSFSGKTGAASLHVALNGVSIAVLPPTRRGRSSLRIERELLRGFNELLLQISYPERPSRAGQSCDVDHDTSAWVELSPDSRLKLGKSERYAMLPDLGLFLYDGFPFTEHGDLRDTLFVLPSEPLPSELSAMLGATAHLASITGHPPTQLMVALGTPDRGTLAAHDVLLVAASGRHPWFQQLGDALPLTRGRDGATAQYPLPSQRWSRYLAGRFDDGELKRAKGALEVKHYAAVMGVPSPWAPARSLVVITASEPTRMPRLTDLLGYASAERPRNDLLLKTEDGRSLFQLSTEHGRGQLSWWMSARWWLAHFWLLLLPILGASSLLWAVFARQKLASIAATRLQEADV